MPVRRVRCNECGKHYDYDEDGFCPKCGAFNQPAKKSYIGGDGSLVRRDGINERNHAGSFVHQELHREDRARKHTDLETFRQAVTQTVRSGSGGDGREQQGKNPMKAIGLVILVIVLLNMLAMILSVFRW